MVTSQTLTANALASPTMELLASSDATYSTESVDQLRADCTDLQWAFAEAYVSCGGCSREAATKAGYQGTVATRDRLACRNLEKPHVRRAIGYFIWQKGISIDHALALLADVVRGARMDHFIDVDSRGGFRVNLEKAQKRGALKHIKKLKHTEYGVEVELFSRMDALKALSGILQKAIIHREQEERLSKTGAEESLRQAGVSEQTLNVLNINL